jgi:hypothetical protein
MFRGSKEYSLDELLEHPILSVQITSEGIERRCLDLMLDAVSSHRRFAETEHDDRLPEQHLSPILTRAEVIPPG